MRKSRNRLSIEDLLGKTFSCSCGAKHVIPTLEVVIAEGALAEIANCCKRNFKGEGILLVADPNTWKVAGRLVARYLREARLKVRHLILHEEINGRVIASDENVDYVLSHINANVDFLVAVGAGSINDIVKLASFKAGRPYVVCPTAPSMNGYTSGIAAIMRKGVKRTVAAQAPVAVIADLLVLTFAPAALQRAGLGDMLSKTVSNADWKLSHLIKGGFYCDLPLDIVDEAEKSCRRFADSIGKSEPKGIRVLTEALLMSGISMVIAGSSSPASGGEHLISHFWDMTAHLNNRNPHLHGEQVGVATIVTSTLYEKMRQIDPSEINLSNLRKHYPDLERLAERIEKIHGPFHKEVLAEVTKKYLTLEAKEREWSFILKNWQDIWRDLSQILISSDQIKKSLKQAKAPVTVQELGISPEELRNAFIHAKDIRSRYSILDFADDLGLLEYLMEPVLMESGVLE